MMVANLSDSGVALVNQISNNARHFGPASWGPGGDIGAPDPAIARRFGRDRHSTKGVVYHE